MCKVIKKINKRKFTGYKVASKIDGKYFSPATGVEYIAGKKVTQKTVCEEEDYAEAFMKGWARIQDIVLPTGKFYDKRMIGKTGVFVSKDDALRLLRACSKDDILVKMTISENLHSALFDGNDVIVGEFIESIEELL